MQLNSIDNNNMKEESLYVVGFSCGGGGVNGNTFDTT